MFQQYRNKFFRTPGGLLPLDEDKRDLGAFNFWGIFEKDYKPTHKKKVIKAFSALDQGRFNTCGWVGEVGMKEIDEQVRLSPRSFVLAGKSLGYISGDGFSTLRNNEKALKNVGVAEKTLLVESNTGWNDYSNLKYFTDEIQENAKIHRSKSFLRLYNVGEVYKAIDDNRPVSIGIAWYTGYNMSNGFKNPWIIYDKKGYPVGGHKMYVRGYDTEYMTKQVFVTRNSFGSGWGDSGDLYLTEDYLQSQISAYGAFINYDLDVDITRWIIDNKFSLVRTKDKSTVYYIIDGKKRPFKNYEDLKTFTRLTPIFHYPNINVNIKYINKSILDKVPEGTFMLS